MHGNADQSSESQWERLPCRWAWTQASDCLSDETLHRLNLNSKPNRITSLNGQFLLLPPLAFSCVLDQILSLPLQFSVFPSPYGPSVLLFDSYQKLYVQVFKDETFRVFWYSFNIHPHSDTAHRAYMEDIYLRIACTRQFSPSTTWILGLNAGGSSFYPLNHLQDHEAALQCTDGLHQHRVPPKM